MGTTSFRIMVNTADAAGLLGQRVARTSVEGTTLYAYPRSSEPIVERAAFRWTTTKPGDDYDSATARSVDFLGPGALEQKLGIPAPAAGGAPDAPAGLEPFRLGGGPFGQAWDHEVAMRRLEPGEVGVLVTSGKQDYGWKGARTALPTAFEGLVENALQSSGQARRHATEGAGALVRMPE